MHIPGPNVVRDVPGNWEHARARQSVCDDPDDRRRRRQALVWLEPPPPCNDNDDARDNDESLLRGSLRSSAHEPRRCSRITGRPASASGPRGCARPTSRLSCPIARAMLRRYSRAGRTAVSTRSSFLQRHPNSSTCLRYRAHGESPRRGVGRVGLRATHGGCVSVCVSVSTCVCVGVGAESSPCG